MESPYNPGSKPPHNQYVYPYELVDVMKDIRTLLQEVRDYLCEPDEDEDYQDLLDAIEAGGLDHV